jgi:hypothetical protein
MTTSVETAPQAPPSGPTPSGLYPAQVRAMALWPRLDRRALARCGGNPARIANYVSRRTRLPAKAIETLLSQS